MTIKKGKGEARRQGCWRSRFFLPFWLGLRRYWQSFAGAVSADGEEECYEDSDLSGDGSVGGSGCYGCAGDSDTSGEGGALAVDEYGYDVGDSDSAGGGGADAGDGAAGAGGAASDDGAPVVPDGGEVAEDVRRYAAAAGSKVQFVEPADEFGGD